MAFEELNLQINPFGSLSPEERAGLAVVSINLNRYVPLLSNSGFAIQFHGPSGREFKRAGLEYDLIKLPVYTVKQMTEQINRRIEWARREPDKPVPTVSGKSVAELLIKYGDDVAVNDHLYELFEQLTGIHHV